VNVSRLVVLFGAMQLNPHIAIFGLAADASAGDWVYWAAVEGCVAIWYTSLCQGAYFEEMI